MIFLLPILGLTWAFGVVAVNSATVVFQYIFTIFNSFQVSHFAFTLTTRLSIVKLDRSFN